MSKARELLDKIEEANTTKVKELKKESKELKARQKLLKAEAKKRKLKFVYAYRFAGQNSGSREVYLDYDKDYKRTDLEKELKNFKMTQGDVSSMENRDLGVELLYIHSRLFDISSDIYDAQEISLQIVFDDVAEVNSVLKEKGIPFDKPHPVIYRFKKKADFEAAKKVIDDLGIKIVKEVTVGI